MKQRILVVDDEPQEQCRWAIRKAARRRPSSDGELAPADGVLVNFP